MDNKPLNIESKIAFLRLVYKHQELKNEGLSHKKTLHYLKFMSESLGKNNIHIGFDLRPWDKPIDSDVLSSVLTESYCYGMVTCNPYRLTDFGKRKVSEIKIDYLPKLDEHIIMALKSEII